MTRPRSRLITYPGQSLPLEMPTVADLPPVDPAVPATPAGLRLGRALMSRRVSDGLPAGCAYRETAQLVAAGVGAVVAQLELWHSPSLAAAMRGCSVTPGMANCWVCLIDGTLLTQHAYAHRGAAIDRLAAAITSPTTATATDTE